MKEKFQLSASRYRNEHVISKTDWNGDDELENQNSL